MTSEVIKVSRYILTVVVIIVCQIAIMSCVFAKDRTFSGKVIDFDTKEPMESAVVVAYWYKARATISGESTTHKEVKETLTDKNGEWSIIGEEGEPYDPLPYLSLFIPYTRHPLFIIFKPGYEPLDVGRYTPSFMASSYLDKKQNLEGIILYIGEKARKYAQEYRERDPSAVYIPSTFIPMKDTETKLRNLDFPFDYPEDVKRIFTKRSFWFENYTVIGLKKLKTREERLKAHPGPIYSGDEREKEFLEKQKEFIRLLEQEDRYLWPNKDSSGGKK